MAGTVEADCSSPVRQHCVNSHKELQTEHQTSRNQCVGLGPRPLVISEIEVGGRKMDSWKSLRVWCTMPDPCLGHPPHLRTVTHCHALY
jgi:hypothetical protein